MNSASDRGAAIGNGSSSSSVVVEITTSNFTNSTAPITTAILKHIHNAATSVATTGAQHNYWSIPPVPVSANEYGVNTSNQRGTPIDSTVCPQNPPVPIPSPTSFKIHIMDDGTRSWSAAETQGINDGVMQIGQAFDYLASTVSTSEDAFNLAMLESSGTEILFIRTEQPGLATVTISNYQYQHGSRMGQTATFSYPGIPEGYCITYQEGIVPTDILRPAAVLCNGNLIDHYTGTTQTLEADQHTVVHELGHLFDYRTGNGLSAPIDGAFFLLDCNTEVVMGAFGGGWTRGRRGWETGPAQYYVTPGGSIAPLVTDFQQNTATIPIEAAADSFLNWVYRLNATGGTLAVDSCSVTPLPAYDEWSGPGFLNYEWSATPHPSFIPDSAGLPGTPDPSLPGNRRHFDIDARIRQIFSLNGW